MFQFLDDINQFSARLPAFDSLHTFDVESAKETLFCVIDMDMSRSVIPDKPLDSIPTAGDLAHWSRLLNQAPVVDLTKFVSAKFRKSELFRASLRPDWYFRPGLIEAFYE